MLILKNNVSFYKKCQQMSYFIVIKITQKKQ